MANTVEKQKQLKIGIIAAPERAAEISENMIDILPDRFAEQINPEMDWEVEQLVDPLTGAAEAAQDILYNATHIKHNKNWDYAICLTDLPILYQKNVVAADISFHEQVAQISIPAFGSIPMQKQIERTIIQLLSELYEQDTIEQPKHYNSRMKERQQEKSMTHLFKRQFPIMPIRRQENPDIVFKSKLDFAHNEYRDPSDADMENKNLIDEEGDHTQTKDAGETNENNVDVRFLVFPRLHGQLRLILGMTFANNPLKIMTSFKNVIAIAFTTGAFALIFPTIWNLGQLFSVYRLFGMMMTATLGLVAWIIIAHHLWELPSSRNKPKIRRLYNLATVLTLIIDVAAYYLFIFTLFFLACLIFIPFDYFQSMIHDYDGSGLILIHYMRVAWAAASISTIVSAIGAGLENEELVRNITYGYRQRRRYEEINRHKNS